jgi:Ca-activated chloride channel family protein
VTFGLDFIAPTRLWLLLVAVGMAAVYVVLQARRRRDAVRFTNIALLDTVAPKRPGWRRHLPAAAFVVATAALVVAFARPTDDVRVPRERATIIMAVDTSLSMEATDVEPSRLAAAQQAASAFLQQLPETINVGLVTFDGIARVQVPPTTDHLAVERAVQSIELGEGTAIGEAIFASLDAIDQVLARTDGGGDEGDGRVPGAIVLMSDGETTVGRPNELGVEAAVEAGVPVSTIAFGTDLGTIELAGEPFPIAVPVNEEALGQIAEGTDGRAFSAASEEELAAVYRDIGSSIGYETEEQEITGWFVGAALVAMMAAAAMSLVWFSRLP